MLDNEAIVLSHVFFSQIAGMWPEESWFLSGGIHDLPEEGQDMSGLWGQSAGLQLQRCLLRVLQSIFPQERTQGERFACNNTFDLIQ